MRISDWSSDVCSSDLDAGTTRRAEHGDLVLRLHEGRRHRAEHPLARLGRVGVVAHHAEGVGRAGLEREIVHLVVEQHAGARRDQARAVQRSEEHTSELQSLMRISYAVFCLKKTRTIQKRLKVTTQTQKQI